MKVIRDLNRGSSFALYGRPLTHPTRTRPVEPYGLARYPVSLVGDQFWIDHAAGAVFQASHRL